MKFGIIVDKDNVKKGFYVLDEKGYPIGYEFDQTLNNDGEVIDKKYREGDKLIIEEWNKANAMNKPRWNGEKWIEMEPLTEIFAPRLDPTTEWLLDHDELLLELTLTQEEMKLSQELTMGGE